MFVNEWDMLFLGGIMVQNTSNLTSANLSKYSSLSFMILLNILLIEILSERETSTQAHAINNPHKLPLTIQINVCRVIVNQWISELTLRKKGTKAVTGAVPFQKVHFCPF